MGIRDGESGLGILTVQLLGGLDSAAPTKNCPLEERCRNSAETGKRRRTGNSATNLSDPSHDHGIKCTYDGAAVLKNGVYTNDRKCGVFFFFFYLSFYDLCASVFWVFSSFFFIKTGDFGGVQLNVD